MFDRSRRWIGHQQDRRTDRWSCRFVERRERRNERSTPTVVLAIKKYDFVFAENGLVAYKNGEQFFEEVRAERETSEIDSPRFFQNIQKHIGEENLQTFLNYCLKYLSEIRLPVKRFVAIDGRRTGRSSSLCLQRHFHRISQWFDQCVTDWKKLFEGRERSIRTLRQGLSLLRSSRGSWFPLQEHQIRARMVEDLKGKFGGMGLVFSIGLSLSSSSV